MAKAKPVAKAGRLKVFRTPIGFDDAWVAAPSRKAALAAWGADRDLFARGIAEEVTDPALTAAALARPGTVIRTSRGTAAEQLAALPPKPKRAARAATAPPDPDKPVARPKRARPPRPDRGALDKAEADLRKAERIARDVGQDFDAREAILARERRAAERTARDTVRKQEQARDRAQAAFERAMAEWGG
jgi:hypothetical protein